MTLQRFQKGFFSTMSGNISKAWRWIIANLTSFWGSYIVLQIKDSKWTISLVIWKLKNAGLFTVILKLEEELINTYFLTLRVCLFLRSLNEILSHSTYRAD